METHFSQKQLADPALNEAEFDPAPLRALRLLYRDLLQLCAAG